MPHNQNYRFWRAAVASSVALALVTFVCFQLELDLATTSFLYLNVIVLVSLQGSLLLSAVLSLIAVGCLAYYFAPPAFSFQVDEPLEALAIIAFLTTSAVITHLVSRARRSAKEALSELEDRERAEVALKRSGAAVREQASLLDLTHDSIFVRGMDDVITYWNRGAEELYGWTAEKAVGRASHQLLQTVFPAAFDEISAQLLRAGRWEGELVHTKSDGAQVVVASRWALQPDAQGNPLAVLETNNDITASKRAAQALQQQANLLEQAHDAIIVWEFPGTIVYWNRGAELLYGFSRVEAIGRASHELLHTEHPMVKPEFEAALERDGEWTGELTHTTRDGRKIIVESRQVLMSETDGRRFVLETNRDITESKRAEAGLRESERRHRYIFQATGVSIWEQDFSQVKMAIDELQAGGVRDFRRYLAAHPEFAQHALAMVKIVDVNEMTVKLFAAESKDEFLVSLHKVFVPETQEVFVQELIAIAEGRTSFEAETVLWTLKGERLTVLFTITFPPPPARFDSVLMTVTDITERKLAEAERARLGERLRQAEKMQAVGRLAGGIAHDFNNILGGILGYSELLAEGTQPGSPHRRYAENVLTAANRASALVQQILYYSRSQRGKRVPVQLDRIVAESLELVRGSLRPGIQLEAKVPATPLFVVGDPTQLHQILMNLCTNAIQAMGEGGTLRVAIEAADAGAERALAHGTLQPGLYVRLTVEDTGPGMDDATVARIFEPFFTTKEVGKGTGLGLSLVYGIVTDSGGGIDVTSAPGRGSVFTIYLPRVDTAVEAAAENQGPVARGNGERLLVVDDEESLVALTSEVLLRLGYEPVGFSDSRAALAAFESAPERFDAAITDEVMPQLTGTELAALLRRRRADLPIVLVSGYIGPLLAERAHGAGVTEILKKPVQSREIAKALAHVLHVQGAPSPPSSAASTA